MPTIRYEKQDNIGIITINRPEALNALNTAVFNELEPKPLYSMPSNILPSTRAVSLIDSFLPI